MIKTKPVLAMLAIAGTLTGSAVMTAPGAVAMPDLTDATAITAGTRVTTTPHLGPPGEGRDNRDVPAIGPDGRMWPRVRATNPHAPPPAPKGEVHATGTWKLGYAVAAGVRIRRSPVNGAVLGTLARGEDVWVNCYVTGSDGHPWDWVYRNGTYGWSYAYYIGGVGGSSALRC